MRQPAVKKKPRGRAVAKSTTFPAPTGGWNTRDPIASMSPQYATILDNWFPQLNDLLLRKGYSSHATGVSTVESLMVYNAIDGTQKMFAASGTAIHDVSSSGAVGAAVQSGLSNARWYDVNFTNSSGTSYLCCFNGVDGPRYYDGTNWTTITDVSTPAITGVTAANLVYPIVHKRRMFLIEKNTLKVWYLPIDSVGGAANALDASGHASKGGYLVSGATWTLDAGDGLDDYLALVTSEGQLIVYSGTNPASDYVLMGVWNLAEPIGRRCMIKYGGDVVLLLKEGVFSLSSYLKEPSPASALTYNISPTFNEAAFSNYSTFGWQAIHYPSAQMLICNVPKPSQEQYVMNTTSGAWCRFTGMGANCWAVYNQELYFGGSGAVYKAWDGNKDLTASISGDVRHHFSYLGLPGRIKKINAMRPSVLSNGAVKLLVGNNTDFETVPLAGGENFTSTTYGTWGLSLWGVGIWGGTLNPFGKWLSASGTGISIAPRVQVQSDVTVRYQSMDVAYEGGEIIG